MSSRINCCGYPQNTRHIYTINKSNEISPRLLVATDIFVLDSVSPIIQNQFHFDLLKVNVTRVSTHIQSGIQNVKLPQLNFFMSIKLIGHIALE